MKPSQIIPLDDLDYAITWCKNGKLNMLLERVERIAEAARKLEERLGK